MTVLSAAQVLENIYVSIKNDNEDLDALIQQLKAALAAEGLTQALIDPTRLVQSNRQGRKLMQSYFKKRGVAVAFPENP